MPVATLRILREPVLRGLDAPGAADGLRAERHLAALSDVTAENAGEIAASGPARWKAESETFNFLGNHDCRPEHNFGHGRRGLADPPVTINPRAFALHAMTDCLRELWQRCGPRDRFFRMLVTSACCIGFPDWRSLFETMLKERAPPRAVAHRDKRLTRQGRRRAEGPRMPIRRTR